MDTSIFGGKIGFPLGFPKQTNPLNPPAPTSPKEEARRKERQALFRILDTDSSGALDAKELWERYEDGSIPVCFI